MGSLIRKLCTKLISQPTLTQNPYFGGFNFCEYHFKDFQHWMQKQGSEQIIRLFRQELELHPERDIVLNSFNSVSRAGGLQEIALATLT